MRHICGINIIETEGHDLLNFMFFHFIFISLGLQPSLRSLWQCALQAPVRIAMSIEKTKLIKLFLSFNCHLAPISDSFKVIIFTNNMTIIE